MHQFVEDVLKRPDRKEYSCVVRAELISDFLNVLMQQPNVLYELKLSYLQQDKEFLVEFKVFAR